MTDPVKRYRAAVRPVAPQVISPVTRSRTPFWHWAVPLAVVFVIVGVIGTGRQGNVPAQTSAVSSASASESPASSPPASLSPELTSALEGEAPPPIMPKTPQILTLATPVCLDVLDFDKFFQVERTGDQDLINNMPGCWMTLENTGVYREQTVGDYDEIALKRPDGSVLELWTYSGFVTDNPNHAHQ